MRTMGGCEVNEFLVEIMAWDNECEAHFVFLSKIVPSARFHSSAARKVVWSKYGSWHYEEVESPVIGRNFARVTRVMDGDVKLMRHVYHD